MKYIDEAGIMSLLEEASSAKAPEVISALEKAHSLKRLSLREAAALLMVKDEALRKKILETAHFVKDKIYGRRVVLFAPLYISNVCVNDCLYCAFRASNKITNRKRLDLDEIKEQTEWLLKRGHKRVLMIGGEASGDIYRYVDGIKAVYNARVGTNYIRRVNVNCAPLEVSEFKKLKKAGIGTYQLFQETYHDATYRLMHPSGPKKDPDNRIDAIDRAFEAGIDDVGVGVLYGLCDYKFETLGLLSHIEHLEKRFGVGPHTISVPRVEPAHGIDFKIPHPISDDDFKMAVAILRLAVPYTGMILSTRESAAMRDDLCGFGISQISAESRTSPGGYSSRDNNAGAESQFCIGDQRTLDEVIGALIGNGYIPSFCAACYRKERTGKAFMGLAKPGLIKNRCSFNALVTLKEYLDDFASLPVKKAGYSLIERERKALDRTTQDELGEFFSKIETGERDSCV